MSDNSVFVVKDECHKNQKMLLPVPWTGHTIIEEKCDEFEGHLTYLTQSEELLIKKSCEKSWRGAESKLVQPRILATKTGPHGKKHRTFQEEEGFIFERLLSDTWSLRNCDVSLLILFLSILLTCAVGLVFLSKNLQKARNVCKPLINYVCSVILEQLKKKKLVFLSAPCPVWNVEPHQCEESPGYGEAWSDGKVESPWIRKKWWERQCSENQVLCSFLHRWWSKT